MYFGGIYFMVFLHVGPKFDQGIFELLLRFRVHRYAFTAHVEKAFLMIAIEKSDRDALRFLWVKDIWQNPRDFSFEVCQGHIWCGS